MKFAIVFTGVFLLHIGQAYTQQLQQNRKANWLQAGIEVLAKPFFTNIYLTKNNNIKPEFSASFNSTKLNQLIQAASLNKPAIIQFDTGTYNFSLPIDFEDEDSIIIRGRGADSTVLKFTAGVNDDLFIVKGTSDNEATQSITLSANGNRGSNTITVSNNTGNKFQAGNYIKIFQNDAALLEGTSLHVVAQIAKIQSVSGTVLTLNAPLRTDFPIANVARVVEIYPRKWVGFENLKIERVDAVVGSDAASNFAFSYAANCWIKGVVSAYTLEAHASFAHSTNCTVDSVYFHHSHNYSGSPFGKAIGILLEKATGECLIQNSIFAHLRQGILFFKGANGNVYAYNYSTAPVQDILPFNRAPDINFHGLYPFANLVEGNIGQHIHFDNSHGLNGPYNTLLRNRAELFGIRIANTDEHAQNLLGNEVTHQRINIYKPGTDTLIGVMGEYLVEGRGSDHVRFGNYIRCAKDATSVADSISLICNDISYAYPSKPSFLGSYAWPAIGLDSIFERNAIPAKTRYFTITGLSDTVAYVNCAGGAREAISEPGAANGINSLSKQMLVYPNPASDKLNVFVQGYKINEKVQISLYSTTGVLIKKFAGNNNQVLTFEISRLPPGIYILSVQHEKAGNLFKVIKK